MTQFEAQTLTLFVEITACLALAAATGWPPRLRRWALVAACASLVSHPVAWWASLNLPLPMWPRVWTIEGAVVVVEAVIYRLLATPRLTRALVMSLITNALSFGVGLWIIWP